jgi:sarcosine oxidase, subunit alpha
VTDFLDILSFEFRGKKIKARRGDTVASALYRSGRRIFARSFKYHRPRGLLCLSGKCPNCMMNVDGVPNVRTCTTPVREGMRVRHQNAFPSLEHDWLSVAQRFDWMMPVGWYYKSMTNPRTWRAAEPFIRRVAGLGDPPAGVDDGYEYEHSHQHAQVAVIGGGPSGLEAAIEFGERGEQVTLIDDQPELGGHLRYQKRSDVSAQDLIARVKTLPNVEVLQNSYCFGLYEGKLLGIVQPKPHPRAVERLIHLRAQRVLVATGAYEVPLLFPNNDLVGIMLSTAVQRLVHLYGIVPGKAAVVIASGDQGKEVASDLEAASTRVAATVAPQSVIAATGGSSVIGVRTKEGNFACDLLVMCGPRVPDAGLLFQAGAKLEFDASHGAFVPVSLSDFVTAAGDVTGRSLTATTSLPSGEIRFGKRAFVCLCSDVSSADLRDGVAEGFDHIEILKRYTTATMGPCQGRMCQLSAVGICAHETNRSMDETGVTTSRPPNPSVTLGALAGARHHPVRRTPMHYEHETLGAVWLDMGNWKRPRYYKTPECSDEQRCIQEEYRAVRERVGLIDVSTLGKLNVKGRDAGKLLDKVYAGRLSDLRPGRVRYAVICDEAGIMLDDGTVSRLAEDHYFITTTTGNLELVEQWLEWWLVGTGWDVHITNVTGGLAAVNLAGPRARATLAKLTAFDLNTQAFPYMACRQADVKGVEAMLMRIGFVGETGWEIHLPAESGAYLWKALLDAGREFGIRAFAVEAQRLLRLEKRHVIVGVDTDALTNPFGAGMGWVAKLEKEDFIGRAALERLAAEPTQQCLVGFIMSDDSLPEDGAAIVTSGKLAGRVTSVRHSPTHQKAIGLAWVSANLAKEGAEIEIRVDGRLGPARITQQVFYDPEGLRLRM